MKSIKTIQQYNTTYTIYQHGNRSFRVSFTGATSNQVKHITTIFDSVEAAEAYIATCKSMDMFR